MKMSHSFRLISMLSGMLSLMLVPVLFPAFGAGPKGTVIQFTVPHLPASPLMCADGKYFCWLPEGTGPYRAIICHLHGCGMEGTAQSFMNDVMWTSLAKKYHAVFIAPSYNTCGDAITCRNWCYPEQGKSDLNWVAALDTLAKRTSHPEISSIPWSLWGHSGGAWWVTVVTDLYPTRVCCTVPQSYCKNNTNPLAYRVPMLHHDGGSYDAVRNDGCFNDGRSHNALWAHAVNPGTDGHSCANMRTLALPWMDIVMTARLPDSAGAPASKMKPMDTTNAWYGDKTTKTVAPAASFTGNKATACWFPNRRMAVLWRDYVTTTGKAGMVKDSTQPPAPYNVTGTYSNRSIVLKWDCDADIETGIKTFIVYRNGVLLKTMTYTANQSFIGTTGYQAWGFGDDPNPNPAPAMTYTDATVSDTGTYTFQVSCVNYSSLEGAKSDPIVLKSGQVTEVKTSRIVAPVSYAPVSRCWNLGNGRLDLKPGIVDIYDIRGRLLKTMHVKTQSRIDVGSLLENTAESMVMVRNRPR